MASWLRFIPILILILLPISSNAFTDDELKWLNSDNDSITSHVNEGKLNFKPTIDKDLLSTTNHLTIDQHSIDEGWVKIRQCYQQLDELEEVEISFRYRFIKNLEVLSKKNIASVKKDKQSITLYKISANAAICISLESRIFYQNPDLSFTLVNGPFHRKFLDGYYPYHVHLYIHYSEGLLKLLKTSPEAQAGFKITEDTNLIEIDTTFEGKLNIQVNFSLIEKSAPED